MLTPPRSSAPLRRAAPERMLPVWPGWMPTPVADRLNRPVMKLTLCLSGASGCRLVPSSMSAPAPRAHQWSALMPQPMKRAANVFCQTVQAGATGPARECRCGGHGAAAQVAVAAFADRAVRREDQPKRVETLVADGASLVRAMPGQRLAQRQLALGLIGGK